MDTTVITATDHADPTAASWAERRAAELRDQLATGEAQLAELDRRRAGLRETLLRISGAIQVLEELATATAGGSPGSANGRRDG
jgi:hypothetical protein